MRLGVEITTTVAKAGAGRRAAFHRGWPDPLEVVSRAAFVKLNRGCLERCTNPLRILTVTVLQVFCNPLSPSHHGRWAIVSGTRRGAPREHRREYPMSVQPLVLAIDDEPGVLRLIKLELSSQGFRVVTADSGDNGVRLEEEHRPDIV